MPRCLVYNSVFYGMEDKKRVSKLNLMVIRINNANELCNSHPCVMCMDYIKRCGVKKLYYSNAEGEIDMIKIAEFDDYEVLHLSHGMKSNVQIYGTIWLGRLPLSKSTYRWILRLASS